MSNIRDQVGDLTEFTPGNDVARAMLERQWQAQFDALRAEWRRFKLALESIAGTHGTECASPRKVAAEALSHNQGVNDANGG